LCNWAKRLEKFYKQLVHQPLHYTPQGEGMHVLCSADLRGDQLAEQAEESKMKELQHDS